MTSATRSQFWPCALIGHGCCIGSAESVEGSAPRTRSGAPSQICGRQRGQPGDFSRGPRRGGRGQGYGASSGGGGGGGRRAPKAPWWRGDGSSGGGGSQWPALADGGAKQAAALADEDRARLKPILNPGAAGKVENLRKAQIAGLSVMDVAAEVDKLAQARASSELPVTKALDAA